jgi:hypothetical protein
VYDAPLWNQVLEQEEGAPADTAAEFHFGSIAHDNDAIEQAVEETFDAVDMEPLCAGCVRPSSSGSPAQLASHVLSLFPSGVRCT